eukprot:1907200-Prymnesium_polylepis.1
MRQRAPIRLRGRRRHKGACAMRGWRKGLGWGVLRLPCLTCSLGYSSSVSSISCDETSSIERRKLSPSPE